MTKSDKVVSVFEANGGVFRMRPNWIPRVHNLPGHRLRLHPDDYYCFGLRRGAIKERWFTSCVKALNGPLAPADEGFSHVCLSRAYDDTVLFKDAVATLGPRLVGDTLFAAYGGWPMFCKFFDNQNALMHHLHLGDADARRVGHFGKPEAYYFPRELNNHEGTFPVTYFGYNPGTSREEVRRRLLEFDRADNRITELSRAYRLELGTGWYVPPGVTHAPGSYLTYEPQWNSDVGSVQENVASGEAMANDDMTAFIPENRKNDVDAVMALMDWDANVDPLFREKYFRPAIEIATGTDAWSERWVTYGNPYFAAKETVIMPGASATLVDSAAYGCIIIQGYGKFGAFADAAAASNLRWNQLSGDEYFVGIEAARSGVKVSNANAFEPMVILRHFGPDAGAPAMPVVGQ